MKWKCIYSPDEQKAVNTDLAVLQLRHPAASIRSGAPGHERRQIYLKAMPGKERQLTPCDFCAHTTDENVKPCGKCPAVPKA